MKITVTCPCGCGHTFEVEVKEVRNTHFNQDELDRRAEMMREMRRQGIGGKPKGAKDTKPRKPRSDRGKPRLSRNAKEFLASVGSSVEEYREESGN